MLKQQGAESDASAILIFSRPILKHSLSTPLTPFLSG